MAWSGGVFTQTDGTYSGDGICASQAGDGDARIKAAEMDALLEDHADGINACLNKDGSNAATGDLDLGTNKVTNMGAGAATGDSGRWDEDVASLTVDGTNLEANLNSGATLTVDLASIASAGEVTLSGAQTITGKKTFSGGLVATGALKPAAATYWAMGYNNNTSSGRTHDVSALSRRFIRNTAAFTLTLDVPVYASDADLGGDWCTSGAIGFYNASGHGAVTVSCPNADYTQAIGSRPTGLGDIYTLVYEIWYSATSSEVYAKWSWVSP